jgi:hypothetical protein
MDISDIHSSMLLLKMQLKALEVQATPHIDSGAGKSMREDIERWKLEWRDVNLRLQQRRHVYRRGSSSATSSSILDDFGNGMSSRSMHTSLSITRPGLMWSLDADPFIDDGPLPDIESQEAEMEAGTNKEVETEKNGTIEKEPVEEKETPGKDDPDEGKSNDTSYYSPAEPESDELELESPPPEKTPWQELWHSLTEYAGIMDYESDD